MTEYQLKEALWERNLSKQGNKTIMLEYFLHNMNFNNNTEVTLSSSLSMFTYYSNSR